MDVTLAWDSKCEPDLGGYIICYNMANKNLGSSFLLVAIGVIGIIFSASADLLGIGRPGFGPMQLCLRWLFALC